MKRVFWSAIVVAMTGITAGAPAQAADNIMKVCGAKYQAAKTAKTLPAGQTWNQYLAACRGTQPKTVAAAPAPAMTTAAAKPIGATTAAPAKAGWMSRFSKPAAPATAAAVPVAARPMAAATPAARTPGTQSAGMAAMHDRQRQCGAQWKADKAAGKIPAGQTWPKYWSACNTRMKG